MPRRSRSSTANSASRRSPKRRRRSLSNDRSVRDRELAGDGSLKGRKLVTTRDEFLQKNKALQAVDRTEGREDTALKTKSVNLHIEENRSEHHTSEYEHEELLVRRGQKFKVSLSFNRPYNESQDSLVLQFVTGKRPQESKDSLIRIKVGEAKTHGPNRWLSEVVNSEEKTTTLSVTSSADAIVGKYEMFAESRTSFEDAETSLHRHEFDDEIFILFNAWCEDDEVYLAGEKERDEYVMNETGRIWQGTHKNYEAIPWNFGQFEDVALNTALYLLDKSELGDGARGNPVLVIRTLSARINGMDDRGLLEGRWEEDFPRNTTKPWEWTGSVEILEQFYRRKRTVKYGQCWVFSGVATTLLRALGIPTRSVTNFESAHDTDASMTIDVHWDENDEPKEELNDSIWNYHVWNEAWCQRPDLPDDRDGNPYDGWQAFDATPQEASEGIMRCGPAPVKAIKNGDVYLPYDAPFIFAEVNGDRVHWLVDEEGAMTPISKETDTIGMKISTKSVGWNRRNDITDEYKYLEGSTKERRAIRKAFRYSTRREYEIYDIADPDVKFQLVTPDAVQIGDGFELKVRLQNLTDEDRTVSFRVSGIMSYYTGVPSERVFSHNVTDQLQPKQEREEVLTVSHEEYMKFVKPDPSIQVYLKGSVKETKKSYAHYETFAFTKPPLQLEVTPSKVAKHEEFELRVRFTNPLHENLTNASIHVEASSIVKSLHIKCRRSVGPGEEIDETATLTARRSGTKEIVANLTSDQFSGVTGTAEVQVSFGS